MPGVPLIAYPREPLRADNQLWQMVPSDKPPGVHIVSKLTGEVIDILGSSSAPGAQIIAFSRNRPVSDNQLWFFVPLLYEFQPGVGGGPAF